MEDILNFSKGLEGKKQVLETNTHHYSRIGVITQGIDFYGIRLEFGHEELRGNASATRLEAAFNIRPLLPPALTDDYQIAELEKRYNHFISCGDNLLEREKTEEARGYYRHALEIAVKIGNSKATGMLFSCIGYTYVLDGNDDVAMSCYQQSLDIAKESGDIEQEADCLMKMSYLLSSQEAVGYHFRALGIYKKTTDNEGIQVALVNIGTTFFDLDEYNKAINFSWKALQVQTKDEISDIDCKIIAYFNIGRAFELMGKTLLALDSYKQAFQQCKKLNNYVQTNPRKKEQLTKIEFIISRRILSLNPISNVLSN